MPRSPRWSSGCHSATAPTATLLAPAPGTHYTIKPVCLTAGKLIDLCNWGKSHSAAHTLSPAQPCLHPCGCMSTPQLSWRPLQDPLLSAWPHGSFLCTHNSPVASSEAAQGTPITLTGMGRAPSPCAGPCARGSGCRIWPPARVSVQVLEQLPASKAAQQLQIFYLCSFLLSAL